LKNGFAVRYRRLLSAFTLLCGFYVRPQIYMASDKCDIASVYECVCTLGTSHLHGTSTPHRQEKRFNRLSLVKEAYERTR